MSVVVDGRAGLEDVDGAKTESDAASVVALIPLENGCLLQYVLVGTRDRTVADALSSETTRRLRAEMGRRWSMISRVK